MYEASEACQRACNSAALIKIRDALITYCNDYHASCRYCPLYDTDGCDYIIMLSRGARIAGRDYPELSTAFADAVIAGLKLQKSEDD